MQIVNTAYYVDILHERYPDLPKKQLQKLCVMFMRRLYTAIAHHGDDVLFKSSGRGKEGESLMLKIYRRDFNYLRHNERVHKRAMELQKQRREQRRLERIRKHFGCKVSEYYREIDEREARQAYEKNRAYVQRIREKTAGYTPVNPDLSLEE
jgi:hypothetical protein